MIKKKNDVFILNDQIPLLDKKKFIFLIDKAKKNKNHRARFCTHKNSKKKLHEMFIVLTKKCKIKPHKHKFKEESLHVIYGMADLIIYNNKGKLTRKINLGTFSSGKTFYYRINNESFHTLNVKSQYFIFHESTSGPFIRKNTIYLNWKTKKN